MKHFYTLSVVLVVSILSLGGCQLRSSQNIQTDKVDVVASFFPLAHVVEQVGQEYVTVHTVIPFGVEPHDFEPTTGDISAATEGDLFVFQGAGFDPWADAIADDVRSNHIPIIQMTEQFTLDASDPHIWLDPIYMQEQVNIITDTLIDIDPDHTEEYRNNAQRYREQLDELNEAFEDELLECQTRKIIVSHDAFHYLAARYNIETIPIAGLSPDQEPNPRQIAELTDVARANNITTIFFETLASPKLAETIASEVGAQTAVLNPLEGLTQEQIEQGETYISVMHENLDHLRSAMQCM